LVDWYTAGSQDDGIVGAMAHAFGAAGGNEGDLMLLGGWRSRAMLDRYGKAAAADPACGARKLSSAA
jgi:hypothetical protein